MNLVHTTKDIITLQQYLAAADDHDLVRALDRAKSMRDEDDRHASP